ESRRFLTPLPRTNLARLHRGLRFPWQLPRMRTSLDLRAPDDRISAIRVTLPGFVSPGVVRTEQYECRFLARNATRLVSFGIEATPKTNKGVGLPLIPNRARSPVPGMNPCLRRKSE